MSAPQRLSVTDSIQLSCIQTERFKTGVLTLTLCLPLTKENTMLGMLLPRVLRRGTEHFPDMASIHRRLDELYASCVEIRSTRIGRNLAIVVTAEFLDEAYATDHTQILDGVLEVISDMLLRPKMVREAFDPAIVKQEIGFAKDSIRSEINNTRAYSLIRCMELMHRNDRTYPTLKEMETEIDGIDAEQLARFYRNTLRSASIQAFFVGSLAPSYVSNCLRTHLGEWHSEILYPILPPYAAPSCGVIEQTLPMPVSQGKLAMGFRTGVCADGADDDVYTAMVFNELFGESPASKLFMNVREKMSLCYSCSSFFNRYTGILLVSAGIESKNRQTAEQAILDQLQSIRHGEISDAEMHAAKLSLANSYRQINDNPFELQSFYSNRAIFGLDGDVEDCRARLDAVTVEQVVALAKKIECDTVFFIEGTRADADENEEDCDDE